MKTKEINSLNQAKRRDMFCLRCKRSYTATYHLNCPQCGQKLLDKENIPKCPTCQSQNVSKITSAKRITHGVTFGIFSKTAFSQYECKNCGYKW